jgi:hypothetical protein
MKHFNNNVPLLVCTTYFIFAIASACIATSGKLPKSLESFNFLSTDEKNIISNLDEMSPEINKTLMYKAHMNSPVTFANTCMASLPNNVKVTKQTIEDKNNFADHLYKLSFQSGLFAGEINEIIQSSALCFTVALTIIIYVSGAPFFSLISLPSFCAHWVKEIKIMGGRKSRRATSTFFVTLLLSQHIHLTAGHFGSMCVGTDDPSKGVNDICSTDNVYIYMNQNHDQLVGDCYAQKNQGRMDVNTQTPFSARPSIGNVMDQVATADMFSVPACTGSSATSTNGICKANNMEPYHCAGNKAHWHRYGPIGQRTDQQNTLTASYYGGSCTCGGCTVPTGVKSTLVFTTKVCTCTVAGEGLNNGICSACTKGKSAADGKSPCIACPLGQYQDQNEATSYGCKTCAAGKVAASASVSCTSCSTGKSQEKGKTLF